MCHTGITAGSVLSRGADWPRGLYVFLSLVVQHVLLCCGGASMHHVSQRSWWNLWVCNTCKRTLKRAGAHEQDLCTDLRQTAHSHIVSDHSCACRRPRRARRWWVMLLVLLSECARCADTVGLCCHAPSLLCTGASVSCCLPGPFRQRVPSGNCPEASSSPDRQGQCCQH